MSHQFHFYLIAFQSMSTAPCFLYATKMKNGRHKKKKKNRKIRRNNNNNNTWKHNNKNIEEKKTTSHSKVKVKGINHHQ